jgi:hypothetical protein
MGRVWLGLHDLLLLRAGCRESGARFRIIFHHARDKAFDERMIPLNTPVYERRFAQRNQSVFCGSGVALC